ncbi:hypothetical protein T310_6244, partial [Rasamsonia emersonii CBS 393.64]
VSHSYSAGQHSLSLLRLPSGAMPPNGDPDAEDAPSDTCQYPNNQENEKRTLRPKAPSQRTSYIEEQEKEAARREAIRAKKGKRSAPDEPNNEGPASTQITTDGHARVTKREMASGWLYVKSLLSTGSEVQKELSCGNFLSLEMSTLNIIKCSSARTTKSPLGHYHRTAFIVVQAPPHGKNRCATTQGEQLIALMMTSIHCRRGSRWMSAWLRHNYCASVS